MAPKQIAALLLDLDGTLLNLDVNQFVPAYISCLAQRFTDYAAPEDFARHLLAATQLTIDNDDPTLTNRDVFFKEFCRRIGQPEAVILPAIDQFYADDFPRLSHWGKPRTHARDVITAARKRGLKLILATQPVFPPTAIEQRLTWGGLAGTDFDLITHVENMHFCKPNPAYYLEITRKIDCPPGLCLMAGNDVQEDLCAAAAGMSTFLVEGFILDRGDKAPLTEYRGSLQELAGLIKSGFAN